MTVTNVESLGGETLIYGYLGDAPAERGAEEETTSCEIIVKASADFSAQRGEILEVAVNLRKLHLFDRASEACINPPIPTENLCPCRLEEGALVLSGQRFPLPPALSGRGTDSPEKIRGRLERALAEYSEAQDAGFYQYIIVNDDPEVAAMEIDSILTAEQCRFSERKYILSEV